MQKILKTNRLTLIPLSEEHFDYQYQLDSNADVMAFLHGPRNRQTCREELSQFIDSASRGLGYWVGFVNGAFAGYWILCVPEIYVDNAAGELGYRLLPEFWRQGLAKEGAAELLRYGFENLGLERIYAFTAVSNQASRATMQSVGMAFVKDFVVELDDWPVGADRDGVEYLITSDEWSHTVKQNC
ncbi:GNAT family N-acetyltransferase [Cedecea sp. P7760]|uniref:GNAT family N-acetyltransferase n=1 Tax=Cedecea sp. P7760 TaxID=2726983 RepID=UPI0015A1A9FB|nr:GNAT family N-acetyltransferase [Cedecea sp. P7760]NWC64136.1 GNAT family N-acetyltransferase [Cedecea sp. P7760]